METFLIRALQLILSFSLLVIVHEGGHFFFARLFKIRVEKFYIFFDAWFALFRYKPKNSDTEYGIGWLPLGGYCKISGMIDESMDKEQMSQPPQPWEFRTKPAYQRLLVMAGGVMMNVILAMFIYSMILFAWGDRYIALSDMTLGMKFNEQAQSIGFRDGDIIKSADGVELQRFDMNMIRAIADAREVTVSRGGEDVTIPMPALSLLDIASQDPAFIDAFLPNVVDSVIPAGAFQKSGVARGDSIVGVNGRAIRSWNEFLDAMAEVKARAELEDRKVADLSVVRSRAGVRDTLLMRTDSLFKVGAYGGIVDYKVTALSYGFFESFPAGIAKGASTLRGYVSDMKYVFTKEGAKSIGGFATIGSIFPTVWDWQRFWSMTAFLSIILAFMNILPIPALDGGHILFLLYEIVTRRKPSDKFLEYAQMAGMILLLALLVWANFNDLLRFVF